MLNGLQFLATECTPKFIVLIVKNHNITMGRGIFGPIFEVIKNLASKGDLWEVKMKRAGIGNPALLRASLGSPLLFKSK